jgi:cell division septum initiation protein DivIVA
MSEPTKRTFGTAVGGYNRSEVDQYIAWLQKNLADVESYNSMAIREQQSLRERLVELESQLKANKSPGYAQLGAKFEETLRLAEVESAKLINDAGKEALKIRETTKAEAERLRFEVEDEVNKIRTKATREAKAELGKAKADAGEIREQAEDELQRVQAERASLDKEAAVVRSDADNYAAKVRAELQIEVEKIQTENARLLKRNAEIESEIREKIDQGEKQALEIFRRVQKEAEDMRNEAERELKAATAEAGSLIENAEQTLENARSEADRLSAESEAMALNIVADARSRAERLSMRSLEITRAAIQDAEARLARLPEQQNAIEDFIEETKSMLTPEQELIVSRRKSIEESMRKPVEAEIVDEEPATEVVAEVSAELEEKDN